MLNDGLRDEWLRKLEKTQKAYKAEMNRTSVGF